MKLYLIGICLVIGIVLVACDSSKNNEHKDSTKVPTDSLKNAIKVDSLGNEVTLLVDSLQIPQLKPVTIEEKKFSITFPSQPNKDIDSTNQTTLYIYANDADTERYLLLYRDFTDEEIAGDSPTNFLQKAAEGILKDFAPNEIGLQENLKVSGYEGINLMIGSPEKSFYSWRLFFVNKRLYQVIIVKNLSFPTKEEMQLFSDSFLIKPMG